MRKLLFLLCLLILTLSALATKNFYFSVLDGDAYKFYPKTIGGADYLTDGSGRMALWGLQPPGHWWSASYVESYHGHMAGFTCWLDPRMLPMGGMSGSYLSTDSDFFVYKPRPGQSPQWFVYPSIGQYYHVNPDPSYLQTYEFEGISETGVAVGWVDKMAQYWALGIPPEHGRLPFYTDENGAAHIFVPNLASPEYNIYGIGVSDDGNYVSGANGQTCSTNTNAWRYNRATGITQEVNDSNFGDHVYLSYAQDIRSNGDCLVHIESGSWANYHTGDYIWYADGHFEEINIQNLGGYRIMFWWAMLCYMRWCDGEQNIATIAVNPEGTHSVYAKLSQLGLIKKGIPATRK